MNKKFLIIDDNEDNILTIRAILADEFPDFAVYSETNGIKGIDAAEAQDPDVILLDILMPGLNGYQTCKVIKDRERTRDIPVIFLTAQRETHEVRMKAIEAGGDAFLAKPIDFIEMTAQVRAMLKIREANRERRSIQEQLESMVQERTNELMESQRATLKALEELNEKNTFLESILDTTQEGFVLISNEGLYLETNEAFCRMTGFNRQELRSIRVDDNLLCKQGSRAMELLRVSCEMGRPLLEIEHKTKDGDIIQLEIAVSRLYSGTGAYVCFCRDLSERQRSRQEMNLLQEQLYQAQKMESIGQLAGGIAHDFNNMLGVILGQIELSLDLVPPLSPLKDRLLEIQNAAKRSAVLTRHLLTFARKQTIVPRELDLNETVSGMISILSRLIGEEISLVWEPGQERLPIRMDPGQLDQVLTNLCVNARDAISGAGEIRMRTTRIDVSTQQGMAGSFPSSGEFALLEVRDDGCGMDQAIQSRIFEPFFTTKESGKGTGLGLATVYGIVKQNNAHIQLESAPGKGTAFSILFPLIVESPKNETNLTNPENEGAGTETILLVEDEPILLELMSEMLESLGYTVLECSSPSEALEHARSAKTSIDMLLSDVVLPEMNGIELSDRIRALIPDIPCVFASGYSPEDVQKQGFATKDMHILHKPFSKAELAATIRHTCGNKRTAPV